MEGAARCAKPVNQSLLHLPTTWPVYSTLVCPQQITIRARRHAAQHNLPCPYLAPFRIHCVLRAVVLAISRVSTPCVSCTTTRPSRVQLFQRMHIMTRGRVQGAAGVIGRSSGARGLCFAAERVRPCMPLCARRRAIDHGISRARHETLHARQAGEFHGPHCGERRNRRAARRLVGCVDASAASAPSRAASRECAASSRRSRGRGLRWSVRQSSA